jgi:hypothetical protein
MLNERIGRFWRRVGVGCFAAVVCALAAAPAARADVFSSYQPAGSFVLPGATVALDALPDGRLVTVVVQATPVVQAIVFRETAPGSGAFASLGALPGADVPSFGAAFLRVSPDGTRIAVGNNGGASFANFQVGVFTIAGFAGAWFTANHFDGAWIDNRFVALTAGNFGSPSFVTALDTASPSPGAPSNAVVVANIGGASGGVALDAAGNLYTANGFQLGGPSATGAVRAFSSVTWRAALTSGVPLSFETQGVPIVNLLSGDPLVFDAGGDLVIGGGNTMSQPPDENYFGIVRAAYVQQALGGGGPIPPADPTRVMRLDPDPAAGSFYTVVANRPLQEVVGVPSGSTTAYVFRSSPVTVPATSPWALSLLALALAGGGWAAARRRRA